MYLWKHTQEDVVKPFLVLKQHDDEVNGLDFHKTMGVCCSGSDDQKAIVWDLEGQPMRVLEDHASSVYGIKFLGARQEYSVATCCFDKVTRIFDMRDKEVTKRLKGHVDDVIGIDVTDGGHGESEYIATGSDDGHIHVWDLRQEVKPLYDFDTNNFFNSNNCEVKRVRFSPPGGHIAAATSKGEVLVYTLGGAQPESPAANLRHEVSDDEGQNCVFGISWRWRDDKKCLVSASHDHTSRCWEMY